MKKIVAIGSTTYGIGIPIRTKRAIESGMSCKALQVLTDWSWIVDDNWEKEQPLHHTHHVTSRDQGTWIDFWTGKNYLSLSLSFLNRVRHRDVYCVIPLVCFVGTKIGFGGSFGFIDLPTDLRIVQINPSLYQKVHILLHFSVQSIFENAANILQRILLILAGNEKFLSLEHETMSEERSSSAL
jgi:hypothetical protein